MNGASIQISQSNVQQVQDAAAQASPQAQGQPRNVQTKATGKTYSVTFHNGQTTTSTSAAVAKGTNAPIQQVNSPSHANDTNVVVAKSSGGRALSGNEVNGGSVIEVGGMKTTVRGAEAAGLIARNAAGIYEYTSKAQAYGQGSSKATAQEQEQQQQEQQQPPKQEQAEEASKPVPLDPEGESLLSEFNAAVPSAVLVSGMTNAIKTGELSNTDIATLAKHLNVSQDEARAKATSFQQSLTAQANNAVGPQADAIWQWARGAAPEALQEAMHNHVHYGNLAGYNEIATRYMQNLDTISPATILNSEDGRKRNARVEPNGRISIDTAKGRMLWSAWYSVAPNKPSFKH